MSILLPSILSADFMRLGEQIKIVEEKKIEYLHVDIMDGNFVPSISFGMPVMKSIRKSTDLYFDVHLMIDEPIRYIKEFKESGANMLTIHYEACKDIDETIKAIRDVGCELGLAINPGTNISVLEPFYEKVDMVLVMSVEPGFGGQKFIEGCLDKVRGLRQIRFEKSLDFKIEIDGGVNLENIAMISEAGVDWIVAGTAVFGNDIAKNIDLLNEKIGD